MLARRVVVIADALKLGYDTVLYFDTDAYWKEPSISISAGLISPWVPEWLESLSVHNGTAARRVFHPAVHLYFGCCSPWDVCGVAWNFSAVHARVGSASTGVILVRNTRRARHLLREWWHSRNGWAHPNHKRTARSCSDQAVLWRMWSNRPDLGHSMRVMSAAPGRKIRGCMRNAGTLQLQRDAPSASGWTS